MLATFGNKNPNFFERTAAWIRTLAFDRGIAQRLKANEFLWEGPPLWTVKTDNEKLRFFDKDTAVAWADKHHLSSSCIGNTDASYTSPDTMRWLVQQKALGIDIGSIAQQIMGAYKDNVDDMLVLFNGSTNYDAAAAFSLLKLGFAANRPDVTDAIAQWAVGGPWFWFNSSHMSGPTGDEFARQPKNEDRMCLFARMLSSAALTEWLFEHQPQLKDVLLQTTKWKELQEGLANASPDVQVKWPWIAHDVFGIDVSPLDYARCQKTQMNAFDLHTSFAHDPAAQCYLSYNMLKIAPFEYGIEQKCNHPEVLAFHRKVLAVARKEDPGVVPGTPLVDNLMLGVYLDQRPDEFYAHAQMVFRNALAPQAPVPEVVDCNLFA